MKMNSYTYMYIYRNISTLSPLSLFNINNNNDTYVTIIYLLCIYTSSQEYPFEAEIGDSNTIDNKTVPPKVSIICDNIISN